MVSAFTTFFLTHTIYHISHITHNNQTLLGMTAFVKHGAECDNGYRKYHWYHLYKFHTIRALCELHTEFEIHFSANFAMLSAFNFSAILNSPTSSVGKSDIKLQLPSLQSLLDETALSSKHKTNFGHDLKEMVEKLKRAELKQSAILPEISIQNLFNSWDSILTFGISGLWLLLVTIGTVFLWIKVRSVNLALISIIPAAKAFDLKHTTTLPSVEQDCFTVELPVLVQLIVGLAFLALFLWYCGKISRWFWNQKRNCFKVSQRCFLPPPVHRWTGNILTSFQFLW